MDFQFSARQDGIFVRCSMEHEALAAWFNTEVRSNPALVFQVLEKISPFSTALCSQAIPFIGREYSLYIQGDEVLVKANALDIPQSSADLEPDFSYYDAESIALCGLTDFQHLLQAYIAFAQN